MQIVSFNMNDHTKKNKKSSSWFPEVKIPSAFSRLQISSPDIKHASVVGLGIFEFYRFWFFSIPSFDSSVIKKLYQTFILYLFFQTIWLLLNTMNKNQQAT